VTNELVRNKIRDVVTYSAGKFKLKGLEAEEEELFVATRPGRAPTSKKSRSALRRVPADNTEIVGPPSLNSPQRKIETMPSTSASDATQASDLVIIGDPDKRRFQWFKKLLRDGFELEAVQANTFVEVRRLVKELSFDSEESIVFLCDILPFSNQKSVPDPNLNFTRLEEIASYSEFVCIVTGDHDPKFSKDIRRPHHVHLHTAKPDESDRLTVLAQLRSLGDRLSPPTDLSVIDTITSWDEDDPAVRQQIFSLSESYQPAESKEILFRILRSSLECSTASKIEIQPLGGASTTILLRVMVTSGEQTNDYVFKLTRDLHRLKHEVNSHLEARREDRLRGYGQHVAVLEMPLRSIRASTSDSFNHHYIVNAGQWFATHCRLLRTADFNVFINLETILTADAATVEKKTRGSLPAYRLASKSRSKLLAHRLEMFSSLLEGLSELLYRQPNAISRELKIPWRIEAVEEEESVSFPPYRLSRRVRGQIQDLLDSREALLLGPRLFPKWQDRVDELMILISETSTAADLGSLAHSTPFIFSPVQGNLNSNNVLLWLERENYPFLIELDSYQTSGHSLQDFARLEVETKLALLDRQADSPIDQLPAYDYSASQVRLWIEMDDRLLAHGALDKSALSKSSVSRANLKAKGYRKNVELSYQLVLLLRRKAFEIQQQATGDVLPGPFASEYLPALLYHSMKAASYAPLSVFKRLWAAYAAGSILKRLKNIP
jgi:hypothetical protein